MKTAGEILSVLFDKQFAEKALGYSKFFDSWTDITEKNGIGSAAAHSRIKEVDKGIVLIEMDHPGWKQILQTKQSKLLHDFRYRFPEMDITAISLMLARDDINEEPVPVQEPQTYAPPIKEIIETEAVVKGAGLDSIKDEDFREKLKQLGTIIEENEKEKENVRRS